MDVRLIYTLSPAWPELNLSDEMWLDTLCKLKVFLQRRIENREAMLAEVKDKGKRYGVVVTSGIVAGPMNLFFQW